MRNLLLLLTVAATACSSTKPQIQSGQFGNLNICIDHDTVTCVYQYYADWSDTYGGYGKVNVFYGYGIANASSQTVNLSCGYPGEAPFSGTLTALAGDSVLLLLEKNPDGGYLEADFQNEGYLAAASGAVTCQKYALVAKDGTILFAHENGQDQLAGTLLHTGDVVCVETVKRGRTRVSFESHDLRSPSQGWIPLKALLPANPERWEP